MLPYPPSDELWGGPWTKLITYGILTFTTVLTFIWAWVFFITLPLPFVQTAMRDYIALHWADGNVRFEGARLAWDRHQKSLAIALNNVTIDHNQARVSLDDLLVIPQWSSLIDGHIALHSITGRFLDVTIVPETGVKDDWSGLIDTYGRGMIDKLGPALGLLAAEQELQSLYLDEINLTVNHPTTTWRARANLSLKRRNNRLSANLDARVKPPDCANSKDYRLSDVHLRWDALAGTKIDFTALTPSVLAPCFPVLEQFNLPISGSLTIDDYNLESTSLPVIDLTLHGGSGTFNWANLWDQAIALDQTRMNIHIDRHGTPSIPSLIIKKGSTTLSGRVQGVWDQSYSFDVDADIDQITTDTAKGLWPTSIALPSRRWFFKNITDGQLTAVHADINFSVTDRLIVHRLDGHMQASNITSYYLEGMGPAKDLNGPIAFSENDFDIDITSGRIGQMAINGSQVYLYDLDTDIELAQITVEARGQILDMMAVLDQPPLQASRRMELDSSPSTGTLDGAVKFDFPLKRDLDVTAVNIQASGTINGLRIDRFIGNHNLSGTEVLLSLDNNGLLLHGDMHLSGLTQAGSMLRAYYNFNPDLDYERRYNASFQLDPAFLPPSPYMVDGTPLIEAVWTFYDLEESNDQWVPHSQLDLTLDCTTCTLQWPLLNWKKAPLDETKATLLIDDMGSGFIVRKAMLNSTDLRLNWHGRFDDDYQLRYIYVDQLVLGDSHPEQAKTELEAAIHTFDANGLTIDILARSLDIEPIIDYWLSPSNAPSTSVASYPTAEINLSIFADRIHLKEDVLFDHVRGQVNYMDGHINSAKIKASQTEKYTNGIDLTLTTQSSGLWLIALNAMDAGHLLKAMNYYQGIEQGTLNIKGQIDPLAKRFEARVIIDDLTLKNSPIMLNLLSLPSLTGLFDRLNQGEDMVFRRLEADLDWQSDVLRFSQAAIWNNSLGLSFTGHINTAIHTLEINGEIAPAYTINSIINNIPILGDLLTGDRQFLAANYAMRGPINNPKVTINPLSALTPGFMRGFFDLFTPKPTATDKIGSES